MSERAVLRTGGFSWEARGLVAVMLTALAALVGCETAQPGVVNALGTVRAPLDASPPAVTRAAEQTLTDMGLTIVTSASTATDGTVVARSESNREVNILVDRAADDASQISIRVGIGGDEEVSLAVLRRIRARLAQQPAMEPATTQPAATQPEAKTEAETETEEMEEVGD